MKVLEHHANAAPQLSTVDLRHVHIIDKELARIDRVQTGKEANERTLPRSRGADNGHRAPGRHREGEALEHRGARLVGKAQLLKAQGAGEARRSRRRLRLLLKRRPVQGLEDAFPARHGPEEQVVLLPEGREGLEEQIDIAGEEHYGAEGEAVGLRPKSPGAQEKREG